MKSGKKLIGCLAKAIGLVLLVIASILFLFRNESGIRRVEDMTRIDFPRPIVDFGEIESGDGMFIPSEWIEARFTIPLQEVPAFVEEYRLREEDSPRPLFDSPDQDVRHAALRHMITREGLPSEFYTVSALENRRYREEICPGNPDWGYRLMLDAANGHVWVHLIYQPRDEEYP